MDGIHGLISESGLWVHTRRQVPQPATGIHMDGIHGLISGSGLWAHTRRQVPQPATGIQQFS